MGFLKWLAFCLGMALGLTTLAVAGTVLLTYLFTGRLASIEVSEGKPSMTLMTPDEVVTMVREQVKKAKAAQITGKQGGKNDGTV